MAGKNFNKQKISIMCISYLNSHSEIVENVFGYFSSFAIFFWFYGILAKLGEERGRRGAKALWNLCSKYRATILHYKARLCRALQNVGTSKHVQTHAHWAKLYLDYLLRKNDYPNRVFHWKKSEKNGRSSEIVHN